MINEDAGKKLKLLQSYINVQNRDAQLWNSSDSIITNYIQSSLKRLSWLIEKGDCENIEDEINFYEMRL